MASTLKDFHYESKDVNLLRVSLQVLKEQEQKGLLASLGLGAAVFLGLRYKTNLHGNLAYLVTLISSVSGYNLYTHQARNSYANLAAICNRNASLKLNEMMH